MKRLLFRILVICAIIAAAVLVLNFPYFWANIKILLHRPAPQQSEWQSQGFSAAVKGERDMLSIPSLGITAPIQYAEQASEASFQQALINGVVHYPGTADPGKPGNCYIFGHSSDYIFSKGNYKTIFATLSDIKQGAEIVVSDKEGNVFRYAVTQTKVVSPDDMSVLEQGDMKHAYVTLQTSYPVGTALRRFIVVGEKTE